MYGYVQLCTDQLKPVDYDVYKHMYCGLCHQLAHYSSFSRMFLSFDMTFFLFLSAYEQTQLAGKCQIRGCLKKVDCPDEIIDYWACLSIMMMYQKLLNDLSDGKKTVQTFLFAMKEPWKKVCEKYPHLQKTICDALEENYALEAQRSPDAQKLAGRFGQLASDLILLAPVPQDRSPELTELLSQIARLVGEWIYYIDFYDDVESDRVKKQYNPILIQAQEENVSLETIKDRFKREIDKRVTELQHLCAFLPYNGYRTIIENVIHEGIIRVTGNIYSGLNAKGNIKKTYDRKPDFNEK